MKAITVTEQAAGAAGMKLVERPEPRASINDVVVQVHASGFVNTELGYLQSTGFVVSPTGHVAVSVYSSGAIGRLVPDDVIGLVRRLA